ncbi:hypothetical protein N7470_002570 [Penicillium chermesinum]|nr:hypothetical protein N7470_002570 [Penicillium chermesinum]
MDAKSLGSRPLLGRRMLSRREKAVRWMAAGCAAGMLFLSTSKFFSVENYAAPAPVSTAGFSWDRLEPSTSLEYSDCGGGFECARLEVPMDYNKTDGRARKVVLAIVRLPAKVSIGDPRYGGAVLINPGGPGGRGTEQAFLSGHNLQSIVDAEGDPVNDQIKYEDQYFDIIGFDPRGVGETTPAVTCFPDPVSQRNWELQVEAEGMLGSSPSSLPRNWQRMKALNTGCSMLEMTAHPEGDSMMSYVSTPLVARDMITIVEKHGEWRAKQGRDEQRRHDKTHGFDAQRAIVKRTEWRQGQEQLLYWGRSYGTVLGTTFAALFPDRVARAVLDGVVNMDKYYEGRGPNAVIDADAIFDRFGDYCDFVGPVGCPLYTEGGPEAIKRAYWKLEEELYEMPIPVIATANRGPEVITWTDMKAVLRIAVYQPLLAFRILAEKTAALTRGNPLPMADFKHRGHFSACPSGACSIAGPWSPACTRGQDNGLYSSSAILCTDAEFLTNHTMETFQEVWDGIKNDSLVLGDYWAQLQLGCVGWQAKAKYKFTGMD